MTDDEIRALADTFDTSAELSCFLSNDHYRATASILRELLARAEKAEAERDAARAQGRNEGLRVAANHVTASSPAARRIILDLIDAPAPEPGAQCYDCGRVNGSPYFPDLVVPHEIWNRISPTGDEGGLLCPSCLCAAAHRAGVTCRATFRSGPFFEANAPEPVTVEQAAQVLLELANAP